MQVKEAITALYKLNDDEEICMYWQAKPNNINVYAWAWICEEFPLEISREFNNIFCDTIQSLNELYPYDVRVASGDVIFVEKK